MDDVGNESSSSSSSSHDDTDTDTGVNNHRNNTISTSTLLQSEMSTRIAPIARSWIFDANDLKKTSVKASSCPNTGEMAEFDVIRREGFDDIMQSVAANNNDNDDDDDDDDKQKQFEENFARSLLDALELVSALTPDRYVLYSIYIY